MRIDNCSIELKKSVYNLLAKKYNIVYACDLRNLSCSKEQFIIFQETIKGLHRPYFEINDRILISHMDTDYYDELLPCGMFITNLIRTFIKYNIPLFTLIIITNHHGINKEIDILLKNNSDRPFIIETLLTDILFGDYDEKLYNLPSNIEKITQPGLCMMGRQRSHRVAMFNFINNHSLLNYIVTSFRKLV